MKSFRTVDERGNIRYKNEKGQFHRTDGPAYDCLDKYKAWFINGKLHREDGPALVWASGSSIYYLNDEEYTKEEYKQEVVKLKLGRLLDL